ncbi:MAG: protoporphyrinogen oxidase [Coriobacteriia bacterium]|nr:protoporphyrinogen oxidase [Coriobacteriia bacterium]
MTRIIIIGGGIAGLGAAYKVKRAADAGVDVDFVLLEKDDRLGGKIDGEVVTTDRGDFIIDGGPDSFVNAKPAVHRIAKLLGLDDQKLPSDESRKKTLILKRGRLYEMPDGVMMFAPTKFVPFATTGLFSWPGKIRAGMDLFVKKKQVPEGERNDETLESFITRRMGKEILDSLAEPLVGGVHGSDPAKMSLAATFPNLLEMEQKYGCMIKGFLAQRKMVEAMRKKYPPDPKNPKTFFMGFKGGMHQLTDAMIDAAGREKMRIGAGVRSAEHNTDGTWTVTLTDGSTETGDAVIVATESWAAEPIARGVDETLADTLAQIESSSSGTCSFAFDAEEVGCDMNAFGVLCPALEGRALLAATYSSTKWPGRAPGGAVLLRGFVGGPHNQAIMEQSDEEITAVVLAELRSILGINPKAKPLFSRFYRWTGGMPQYTMGHLDRMDLLDERCDAIPGFALAGGSYRGVGLPNCIESGEAAVSKVLADAGIKYDEPEEPRTY